MCVAAGTTFSSSLHSELVRLSWHQGPTRGFLLDLLCGLAAMHGLADVQREAWVLPAMKDLLESLLSSEDDQMHRSAPPPPPLSPSCPLGGLCLPARNSLAVIHIVCSTKP